MKTQSILWKKWNSWLPQTKITNLIRSGFYKLVCKSKPEISIFIGRSNWDFVYPDMSSPYHANVVSHVLVEIILKYFIRFPTLLCKKNQFILPIERIFNWILKIFLKKWAFNKTEKSNFRNKVANTRLNMLVLNVTIEAFLVLWPYNFDAARRRCMTTNN
jgi:hypothetical protein